MSDGLSGVSNCYGHASPSWTDHLPLLGGKFYFSPSVHNFVHNWLFITNIPQAASLLVLEAFNSLPFSLEVRKMMGIDYSATKYCGLSQNSITPFLTLKALHKQIVPHSDKESPVAQLFSKFSKLFLKKEEVVVYFTSNHVLVRLSVVPFSECCCQSKLMVICSWNARHASTNIPLEEL